MTDTSPRPVLIWLALLYIALSLLVHAWVLYRNVEDLLNVGPAGIIALVLSISLAILEIATFYAIWHGLRWGKSLGIFTFSLIGVLVVPSVMIFLQWPELIKISFAEKIVAVMRILLSFSLVLVFAVSNSVAKYFAVGNDRVSELT